jgi:hypothetical protein
MRNGVFVLALLGNQCRGEPAPSVAPSASISGREPTAAAGAPASTSHAGAASAATVLAPAGASAQQPALPAPSAVSSSETPTSRAAGKTSSEADSDEPALLAADGSPLPQTDARPSVTDDRFKRRMQRIAAAIVTGDVEKARSSFFPLVAYAQVKDVQKPERDYRYRLMAHFERDLREYHKALGRDAERAELLGVDVPEERAEWMKPGKEGNRIGYFRVLRSKLRFRLPDGKERSFELTSLISWRGEWYVVHLHGFE